MRAVHAGTSWSHPATSFVLAISEPLEARRMLSAMPAALGRGTKPTKNPLADGPVLIDHGGLTGDMGYQIGARWSTTANGGTGTQGTAITLTWSIVPDGTLLTSGNGEPNAGSDFIARMNGIYGNMNTWLPIVTQVFNEWGNAAGITYVYESHDDGAQMAQFNNGVLGVRGDVRIGAHPIDGGFNVLAYNYFPNFGDMTIDSNDLVSGGFMFGTGGNSRALRNVMAHEHGHGLGFNHVDPVNGTKLMEAFASTSFDGPQLDDILAANRNYGDYLEKNGNNNVAARATDRGTLADGTDLVSMVSMANTSDLDYFKFTIGSDRPVRLTVSPQGFTYLQGPQGGTTTSFNAKAQMDLQFQLLASDGTTVIQTVNATGTGGDESFTNLNLAAGTYYVRVSPAPGAANSAQMYNLSTLVGQSAVPVTDSITPVSPSVRTTPVDSIEINFSEPIDPATFDLSDFTTVTRDTIAESLSSFGVTLTSGDNQHWTLGNLGAFSDRVGSFSLTMGTDIRTSDGRSPSSAQNVAWQMTAINGTSGDDDIRIARAAGFDNLDAVYLNGSPTEAYLFSIASPLNLLTVNSGGGNDRITFDYTAGNLNPGGGIALDTGSGSDTVAARGSSSGDPFTITATSLRRGASSTLVNYSNIEAFDLLRGRFTFTNDAGNIDVTVQDAVSAVVNATQHWNNLSVLGAGTLNMSANGSRLLAVRSLVVDPDAYIDLADNDLLIDYTGASPLGAVQGLINTGRNGGAWQSFLGIGSSSAGINAAHSTTLGAMEATDYKSMNGAGATFDGNALDDTVVLVKYTYYGDTDFNGTVNFDDYVRTDNGFNNNRTGWMNGDFDGNGLVNFDDYVLIDLGFNTQTAVL